jgi:hypothetical protein
VFTREPNLLAQTLPFTVFLQLRKTLHVKSLVRRKIQEILNIFEILYHIGIKALHVGSGRYSRTANRSKLFGLAKLFQMVSTL